MIGPPLGSRARPRRPGTARRGERGGVSWVTLLIVALVAGGAYLAVVWGPVYVENYAVKQTVRDFMNQAVKNRNDDELRRNMVLKIRSLDQRTALDEQGREVTVPTVPLEEGDVTWERDMRSQPPMLRVAFEYTREVAYPMLDRTTTKVFEVDLSNELTIADWGPQR